LGKTEIQRKTLNPVWQYHSARYDLADESLLQDRPIEFKVWDYDVVSSNDIIGVVHLDASTLLLPGSSGQISGWYPIYDTIRGIRGKLNVSIKLQLVDNSNLFKERFFYFILLFYFLLYFYCYSIHFYY